MKPYRALSGFIGLIEGSQCLLQGSKFVSLEIDVIPAVASAQEAQVIL